MSRRAWCRESGSPRSREAFQSNPPGTNRRVILKFYLMNIVRECGRAGHACRCNAAGRSCPNWVSGEQGALQVPRWDSDQSQHGDLIGSCNTRWRRELPGGDTEEPEADNPRGSANQKQTVKSSTMKVAQAIASKRQQRRSQIGKARSGWIRGRFCILPSEISLPKGLETMPGREPWTYLVSTDENPTNVTAGAKDRNNRARIMVAGVVSGAGQVSR